MQDQNIEEKPSVILPIHTSCKNCVFAKYEETGQTQIDCRLGRLDKYRKTGTEILEAFDNEKYKNEFFIVNGRKCGALVTKSLDNPSHCMPVDDLEAKDYVEMFNKSNKIKLTFVIMFNNDSSLKHLSFTIHSLLNQTILPFKIFFVNNSKYIQDKDLHTILYKTIGNKLTWRLTSLQNKDSSDDDAFDNIISQINTSFYSRCDCGVKIPLDFTDKLNIALNENLERFSVLTPSKTVEVLTVQTGFHNNPMTSGNTPSEAIEYNDDETVLSRTKLNNIVEKAIYYAKQQNKEYLVRSVDSLWN